MTGIPGVLGVLAADWEGSEGGTVCLLPDADVTGGTMIPLGIRIADIVDRSTLDFMGFIMDGGLDDALSALDEIPLVPAKPMAIKPSEAGPRVGGFRWRHAGLGRPIQIIGRASIVSDVLFVEPDEFFTSMIPN